MSAGVLEESLLRLLLSLDPGIHHPVSKIMMVSRPVMRG